MRSSLRRAAMKKMIKLSASEAEVEGLTEGMVGEEDAPSKKR